MDTIRLRRITIFAAISAIVMLCFSGCYYDNKQELYQLASGTCDTAGVSYSRDIAPAMALSCNVCHNPSNASAGWKTDTHASLVTTINGGRFVGAIEWSSGFSPMPKGGQQFSQCNINKIKAWIDAKMPNN